jgi:hypothetical protein
MKSFSAPILKIGINPHVVLPAPVLSALFKEAGREKGPIPVRGTLNGHAYLQTVVKYSGKWRLYLNGPMRKVAGIDVGDVATVSIEYDPRKPTFIPHPKLSEALQKNNKARLVFDQLAPSRQKEIIRYISALKTEEAVERAISRAILFLLGKERFVGRDNPR